ncbi:hypothetical protein [Nocardia sp. NBC_01327]|uniref:hypothetical protein n=1 Tax=Nocardia sp. NBC_01327 TaxID=2903593 RepID=UPI002E0F6FE9|nr:hypothetical protein OG326_29400 [Nocardia sp. NBC_01327]
MARRYRTYLALAALSSTVLLSACEQAKEAVNKGGDTPCSEFTAQDQDKQRITVRKYIENDTKTTPTPSPDTVDGSITAITLMCKAQANPDTPIRNADLTGILVPKK